MLIGYARVSTGLQNLDLLSDALTQHGCTKIFYDKMSGTKKQPHENWRYHITYL